MHEVGHPGVYKPGAIKWSLALAGAMFLMWVRDGLFSEGNQKQPDDPIIVDSTTLFVGTIITLVVWAIEVELFLPLVRTFDNPNLRLFRRMLFVATLPTYIYLAATFEQYIVGLSTGYAMIVVFSVLISLIVSMFIYQETDIHLRPHSLVSLALSAFALFPISSLAYLFVRTSARRMFNNSVPEFPDWISCLAVAIVSLWRWLLDFLQSEWYLYLFVISTSIYQLHYDNLSSSYISHIYRVDKYGVVLIYGVINALSLIAASSEQRIAKRREIQSTYTLEKAPAIHSIFDEAVYWRIASLMVVTKMLFFTLIFKNHTSRNNLAHQKLHVYFVRALGVTTALSYVVYQYEFGLWWLVWRIFIGITCVVAFQKCGSFTARVHDEKDTLAKGLVQEMSAKFDDKPKRGKELSQELLELIQERFELKAESQAQAAIQRKYEYLWYFNALTMITEAMVVQMSIC